MKSREGQEMAGAMKERLATTHLWPRRWEDKLVSSAEMRDKISPVSVSPGTDFRTNCHGHGRKTLIETDCNLSLLPSARYLQD